MSTAAGATNEARRLLTPQEVADLLQVSVSWVHKRTGPGATSQIPHHRVGGLLRFDLVEVREWIDQNRASNGAA